MYIGTQPAIGQNRKLDSIAASFNGVLTTFNLTVNTASIVPSNVYQLFISLGGVLQNPGVDFTANGNQITFTTAPTASLSFFGIFQGDSITGTPTIADASITTLKLATGLTVTHAAGTAGVPSITFAGDLANGAFAPMANTFGITTGGAERLRIDSSGRLLVGTSSTRSVTGLNASLQVEGTTYDNSSISLVRNSASNVLDTSVLAFGRSRGSGTTIVTPGDRVGVITFCGANGTDLNTAAATIETYIDGTPGANDMPGRLVFSTTADGAASPTERMRITQAGAIAIGKAGPSTANGISLEQSGAASFNRGGTVVGFFNRNTDDGIIIEFQQDGIPEGTISVSGTTISYNGAHLSRWSQLPGGAEREEILRGTLLSNIDEMCDWGEEDNEQLNRMKVSDVEGDPNASGVFQAWDDDDATYTNDFYCAMTGDFIIRIAEGVTVQRGELLMSAGDGTAKPQDDDIIRSKTVAKVTSTHVTCTYDDGSYCVPCVLMAC